METKHIWPKTILSVYRYLERICDAIDKISIASALASNNISGQNYFLNNIYAISQKLLDLGERKVTLINLKLLTEDVLSKMKEIDANLLIEKYIDGRKAKEISERYKLSLRSAFRKLALAEESFNKKLNLLGYDDEKLSRMLKDERWIINVYDRFAQNEKEVEITTRELSGAV